MSAAAANHRIAAQNNEINKQKGLAGNIMPQSPSLILFLFIFSSAARLIAAHPPAPAEPAVPRQANPSRARLLLRSPDTGDSHLRERLRNARADEPRRRPSRLAVRVVGDKLCQRFAKAKRRRSEELVPPAAGMMCFFAPQRGRQIP